MDISLREWLIIGGVLIVILILVDGWRRVSANRSRLRLEIDRTLSELAEEEPQNNPELPNGGARVRDCEASGAEVAPARVEPGFADDRLDRVSHRDPGMADMDPLFDDIPADNSPRRSPPSGADVTSTSKNTAERIVPVAPVSPELQNLDQPIPVLLDEVEADERTPVPDDTLAAYRQSISESVEQAEVPAAELKGPLTSEMEDKASRTQQTDSVTNSFSESGPAATPATETAAARGSAVAETGPDADAEPAEAEPVRISRGLKNMPDPERVLIITVVGRDGAHLPGPALDKIATACGMEWGDMAIYHRPEGSSADAPIQFSMANAVAPGTFDPANLEALETPAVTFFMSLNEPTDTMTAYECMLATAETLAKHLDGDLLDEDRSVMRPQTKEHYRERIRDFEMHQRQRRAK